MSRRSVGLAMALTSSASFGLSGILASSLLSGGWSAGAVTTVRILGGALALAVPTVWLLRGQWGAVRRAWREVLVLGLMAVALCQLAFFSAVAYITPSLALLIEFLGPVLLVGVTWVRTRRSPALTTLAGAGAAVAGLALISGIGGESLHPVGILLALGAAVGNAAYWATASKTEVDLHPIALAGLGLAVGGVVLGLVCAVGLLPFRARWGEVVLGGQGLPAWMVLVLVILVSTAAAYVTGILGARRLGEALSSFAGYAEPMFGIAWTALLLGILPTGNQWWGALAIVGGVVLVKVGQLDRPRSTESPLVEGIPPI